MNKLILLFGVLICLVVVNARHYAHRRADETSEDQDEYNPKEHVSAHRRKRWQMNYGYDFPAPSYYYPERRDDRLNQETLQNIYRLLEEISSFIKRSPPPPPPQPIYIPYPIAFPSTITNCKTTQNSTNPAAEKRNPFTDNMDQNRNWGIVPPVEEEYGDDDNDGARPISFEPLVPKQVMRRPPPKVDHGSHQASFSDQAPAIETSVPIAAQSEASPSIAYPGMCNAAILSCCGFANDITKQIKCFASIGCPANIGGSTVCSTESIQRALNSFTSAYSPVQ